jgi:hypothetical protein
MELDVTATIEVERPCAEVARFAADPDTATAWYQNIKAVEWQTPRPLGLGSRVSFVAQFLGRRIVYTYEIVECVPGRRLVMRGSEGPFPMETTYTWTEVAPRRTRMALRNRGGPRGIASLLTPIMSIVVRRAISGDLRRLKRILESPDAVGSAS